LFIFTDPSYYWSGGNDDLVQENLGGNVKVLPGRRVRKTLIYKNEQDFDWNA